MPDTNKYGYWIAVGDIHNDFSMISEIPEREGEAGVIVTGDLTYGDGIVQAKKVIRGLSGRTPAILAQVGNMDKPEVTGWLEREGINLHRCAREIFPDVAAIGLGCCPPTPFATPSEYPEGLLAEWLEEAYARAAAWRHIVLVSHTPPYATACDRLSDGTPVGSTAVREFIEKRQPDLCVCGHVHESKAVDRIGDTLIINPGPLSLGGYVVISRPETGVGVTAELKTIYI